MAGIRQFFKAWAQRKTPSSTSEHSEHSLEYVGRKIFKSAIYQSQFEQDGFIVVDLLSAEEIAALVQMHDKNGPAPDYDEMYSSVVDAEFEIRDASFNKASERLFKTIFETKIASLFIDYYFGCGTFISKGIGEKSACGLHQDWSNINDETHFSFNLWCPLMDVTEENGALQVIRGSHLFPKSIRTYGFPSPFLNIEEKLDPYLTPIPMKVGQACIYAHNLYHGSKPNLSQIIRKAMLVSAYPKETPFVFYHLPKGSTEMEVFELEPSYYIHHMPQVLAGGPNLQTIGRRPHVDYPPALSTAELMNLIEQYTPLA